jgi:hypothetical protein
MRKPSMSIERNIHTTEHENLRYLEGGKPLPKVSPLENPELKIALLATALTEVISGVRGVEQLSGDLNEHVYECLKRRAEMKARARSSLLKKPLVQSNRVVRVRIQFPAEGVLESVVIMQGRNRSRAVTIRLEALYDRWRATEVGFL